jgi:hypothetical protein
MSRSYRLDMVHDEDTSVELSVTSERTTPPQVQLLEPLPGFKVKSQHLGECWVLALKITSNWIGWKNLRVLVPSPLFACFMVEVIVLCCRNGAVLLNFGF